MAKKKIANDNLAAVSNEDFSLEDAMAQIEAIVLNLESGKLKLGDSLDQYEAAIGKLKRCHDYLEYAERQVSVLSGVDADGNPITTPMDDESGDGDDLKAKQASRGARRGATKKTTPPSGSAAKSGDAGFDDDDQLTGLF